MYLVFDHVLEALIVRGSEEDHDLHLFSGEAVVHHLVATQLVPEAMQLLRNQLNRTALVR